MGHVTELAEAERADLADLLSGLTTQEWDAPSLCAGWRVRDVVAHALSYEELGLAALGRKAIQGRGVPDRINALCLQDHAGDTPEDLLALVRRSRRPRGLTALADSRIALLDGMIHQQDIRRPLARTRSIPAERLTVALGLARFAPTIGTPWRGRGLRLVATDLSWSAGRGAEVRGPGESLLMAIAGRRGVLPELDGPGVATLAARTS